MSRFLFPALISLLTLWPVTQAQTTQSQLKGHLTPARVDEIVQQFQTQTGVPGVALSIVQDGNIVYLQGYGRTQRHTPMTADTPLRIASMSKAFTALAVLQLTEQGKLSLDAPLYTLLKDFHMADTRDQKVTVRHVLNQTSGLSDLNTGDVLNARQVTPADLMNDLSRAKLTHDPGTHYEYANTNYNLAGLVVEAISGVPLDEYLKTHIFQPLGMKAVQTADCSTQLPD